MQYNMIRFLNRDMEIATIFFSGVCVSTYSTDLAILTYGSIADALIMCPTDYLNDVLI